MYTVKRAAEVIGVSGSTLRAWDRRYGISPSDRSDAGYRLYDQGDMRTLSLMSDLLSEGFSAREAAAEVKRRHALSRSPASGPERSDRDLRELVDVAKALDAAALDRLLEIRFSEASFESVADDWMLPSLAALGTAWREGEVSIAGEHMVVDAVRRRLSVAYEAPRSRKRAPAAVVGLPPGGQHDLGLLAFAVAARRAGVETVFLGTNVPAADWATAVGTNCEAAVLSVSRMRDLAGFKDAALAIGERRPGLLIAVGGALQEKTPADCLRLGHRIGPAAARLAGELGLARPVSP